MSLSQSLRVDQHVHPAHFSMHSFFSRASQKDPGHGNVDSIPLMKDATHVHAHDHSSDVVPATSLPAPATSLSTSAPPATIDALVSVDHKDGISNYDGPSDEYETTNDRRKRRKISQEPGSEPNSELPCHSLTDHTGRYQQSLLVNDLGVSLGGAKNVNQDNQIEQGVQARQQRETATKPQPRRKGRPRKPINTNVQPDQKNAGLDLDMELVEQKSQRIKESNTTPRKTTVTIDMDGKLIDPAKSTKARTSPRTSKVVAPGKPSSGARNLTLKNGRLTRKLVVTLKYDPLGNENVSTGVKIEQILSNESRVSTRQDDITKTPSKANQAKISKSTHPFFLGKPAQQSSATKSIDPAGPDAPHLETVAPVAWKDLVFKTKRPASSRDGPVDKAIWPPISFHHIGAPPRLDALRTDVQYGIGKQKSKTCMESIAEEETLLSKYPRDKTYAGNSQNDLRKPERLRTTTKNALLQIWPGGIQHDDTGAASIMRNKIMERTSAFDRAEASGPYPWSQQYGPSIFEEVLQPECKALYEWLSRLAVHNVKQGLDTKQTKQVSKRKKRPKKRDDEFGDFIDFDEEVSEPTKVKNAVLLVGPSGCGKTASVYAVAKQLGFEIFEIHSGMRRSQKDIFDKVGDMTQNHMVQGGRALSRDSSILHDEGTGSGQEDTIQPAMNAFLTAPNNKNIFNNSRSATPQPGKQEQKQSLILFEEVDHVFEDDRGFWSGVQALVQNSKRPVIMTCNDLRDVPLDELDLHSVLTYNAPSADVVAEYLSYIAVAEGHVVQPNAIKSLYRNRGSDLRATITELDFWCQMTVGSTQGGLDWFPSFQSKPADNVVPLRTFSKDTFRVGLDLLPTVCQDLESTLDFVCDSLNLSCDEIVQSGPHSRKVFDSDLNCLAFPLSLDYLQSRSDAECIHITLQPAVYAASITSEINWTGSLEELHVSEAMSRHVPEGQKPGVSFECLDALAVETSIYSLGQGRLAPSLDGPRAMIACDIAPYVRSIASYDERLEQQRDDLFSSQGKKSRTTRAARAAAEGGDKASTRRDRWFPQNVDLRMVLATGNKWPEWLDVENADTFPMTMNTDQDQAVS